MLSELKQQLLSRLFDLQFYACTLEAWEGQIVCYLCVM